MSFLSNQAWTIYEWLGSFTALSIVYWKFGTLLYHLIVVPVYHHQVTTNITLNI